jgi:hypothetical protein
MLVAVCKEDEAKGCLRNCLYLPQWGQGIAPIGFVGLIQLGWDGGDRKRVAIDGVRMMRNSGGWTLRIVRGARRRHPGVLLLLLLLLQLMVAVHRMTAAPMAQVTVGPWSIFIMSVRVHGALILIMVMNPVTVGTVTMGMVTLVMRMAVGFMVVMVMVVSVVLLRFPVLRLRLWVSRGMILPGVHLGREPGISLMVDKSQSSSMSVAIVPSRGRMFLMAVRLHGTLWKGGWMWMWIGMEWTGLDEMLFGTSGRTEDKEEITREKDPWRRE